MGATELSELAELGTAQWIMIGGLAVVQLGLLAWALVDIMRRSDEEVTGGKRWVWMLVALFINMFGPIIYLLVGRKPKEMEDTGMGASGSSADRTKAAVDALYGNGGGEVGR